MPVWSISHRRHKVMGVVQQSDEKFDLFHSNSHQFFLNLLTVENVLDVKTFVLHQKLTLKLDGSRVLKE